MKVVIEAETSLFDDIDLEDTSPEAKRKLVELMIESGVFFGNDRVRLKTITVAD